MIFYGLFRVLGSHCQQNSQIEFEVIAKFNESDFSPTPKSCQNKHILYFATILKFYDLWICLSVTHNTIKAVHKSFFVYIYFDLHFKSLLKRGTGWFLFILFYFILFYFILFYFILFCFVLFCFVLFYLFYFILQRIFPSNVWMTLHYITKYQTKWLLFYARYTLYDFGLFQTKGDQHETIVVISLVVAPKQLSYVILWFKDGCCHSLTTKDNLQNCPDGVRNLGWPSHSVLLWPKSTDQPIKMQHKMKNQCDIALKLKYHGSKKKNSGNHNYQSVIHLCLFVYK